MKYLLIIGSLLWLLVSFKKKKPTDKMQDNVLYEQSFTDSEVAEMWQ